MRKHASLFFKWSDITADMNSDIPQETTVIFFLAKLYLPQGIISEYVIINFICMGLFKLRGARTINYQMKNSCLQWDSNPVPYAYEVNSLSIARLDLISIEHLKVDRVLPECAIKFTCNTW